MFDARHLAVHATVVHCEPIVLGSLGQRRWRKPTSNNIRSSRCRSSMHLYVDLTKRSPFTTPMAWSQRTIAGTPPRGYILIRARPPIRSIQMT
jgi:hypothetical protein